MQKYYPCIVFDQKLKIRLTPAWRGINVTSLSGTCVTFETGDPFCRNGYFIPEIREMALDIDQ
jgi:hypothetical protein